MTSLLIPAELDVLDAAVAELIAEVDAILCAAIAVDRRPPAPPVTMCAVLRPWSGPPHLVRAVQRSPPTSPIGMPAVSKKGR